MISTSFEWKVTELESLTSNGLVLAIHWNMFATEIEETGDETSNIVLKTRKHGRVGLTSDVVTIPYEEITEEIAANWVKQFVDENKIYEECYEYFNEMRYPKVKREVPWNTVGIAST